MVAVDVGNVEVVSGEWVEPVGEEEKAIRLIEGGSGRIESRVAVQIDAVISAGWGSSTMDKELVSF